MWLLDSIYHHGAYHIAILLQFALSAAAASAKKASS